MNLKAIKLSDYFEIIDPKYIVLKLVPVKSIRNYNSDKIIAAVSVLYRKLTERIVKENKKFFVTRQIKVSYYIFMEKTNIEFYFVIPECYESLLMGKITDTWESITIERVDSMPTVGGDNSIKYYLTYKKDDPLSLATDRRSNSLLTGILNTVDVMEENDRCAVLFNFSPASQTSWRADCVKAIKKYAAGEPMERDKMGGPFLLKMALRIIVEALGLLLESVADVLDAKKPEPDSLIPQQPAPETLKKKDSRVVNTQIMVFSSADSKPHAASNALLLCQAFSTLDSDNELVYRRCFGKPDTFKTTPMECQNFVSLPGKELIQAHPQIGCIDILESPVPLELRNGKICIGTNTYRGHEQSAYLSTDENFQYLSLVLIGPTRAGKTTLIGNITKDATAADECTILLDYCKNCELTDEVCKRVKRSLVIDCANTKVLQGMGYNEADKISTGDVFKRYAMAKMIAMQLIVLLDSISIGREDLSVRMNRYLEAAAVVVFLRNGSIFRVIQCLSDAEARKKEIENVPPEQAANAEKYVMALKELDDEKNGGTRFHLISGIMDRIEKLQQNVYMEQMLEKDCSDNINLIDEMSKSQAICIKIPDEMFPSLPEKDTYCTYWITKIWLALQLRGGGRKVNIVVDELYQVPNCQDFIRSKLSQMAKYHAKMIISAHYLQQISIIRDELKAANSSYILISGADKDNYKELKDELQPYQVEDLICLKRFHALCLMKIGDGYAKFVTKLPPK